ncbi:MAG: glycosyltransferase family 61 protein [Bacteroidetes bacterium]|nr:glycosyltransferase family 61 protein [Bacteroidota bacterium]
MNIAKYKILQSKNVSRKLPVNIINEDVFLFQSEKNAILSNVYSYQITDCCVDSNGIVFDYYGKSCNDLLIWPQHKKQFSIGYLLKNIFKQKYTLQKSNTYFLCFDYWSAGYFHWICEALPRILLVENELRQANSFLLLPEILNKPVYTESLKIFEGLKIHWIPENSYCKCHTLISPNRVSASGSNNPEVINLVKQKILGAYPALQSANKNLYISRQKASRRKIINESEVIFLLLKYNFEVICFEDFLFKEQIQKVQTAKNIISIHGANLTNILFMPENANVLEFIKKDDAENNYYYALADATGLNYYYQLCDYEKKSDIGNNFDLTVEIKKLEQIVKTMLSIK